jgi:hypothetical protein
MAGVALQETKVFWFFFSKKNFFLLFDFRSLEQHRLKPDNGGDEVAL